MSTIDPLSASASPIRMMFGSTPLSAATGFFWKANDDFLLVTNWHNFAGRRPDTGELLSRHGGVPDNVVILPFQKGTLNARLFITIALFGEDGRPAWFVHPAHNRAVDVVALPLPTSLVEKVDLYPLNLNSNTPLRLTAGSDVFILGYPLGPKQALTSPVTPTALMFPVWKRGSVATEPDLKAGPQQHFLIDTASRPGMSGSPVVLRHWPVQILEDGNVNLSTSPATRFVGVYSGRLGTDTALDAQLGICWPAQLVEEIVAARHRDGGL
jgi:hypothetical protein